MNGFSVDFIGERKNFKFFFCSSNEGNLLRYTITLNGPNLVILQMTFPMQGPFKPGVSNVNVNKFKGSGILRSKDRK